MSYQLNHVMNSQIILHIFISHVWRILALQIFFVFEVFTARDEWNFTFPEKQ